MKRFLRVLLDWMERKFPDRVVVTEAAYELMVKTMAEHSFAITELKVCRHDTLVELEAKIALLQEANPEVKELKEKIEAMQGEINKFNVAMGFGIPSTKTGVAAVLQR